MDIFPRILDTTLSVLAALGIVGLIGFAFKEWIKQYIMHVFKSLELEKSIDQALTEKLLNYQIPMKLELSQNVYKLRAAARNVVAANTPLTHDKDDFQQLTSLLTEALFKYRVLLEEDAFAALHGYKRLCQDFLMLLDVSDRPEHIREGNLYFSDSTREKLRSLYAKIDGSHLDIIEKMRDYT